MTKSKRRTLPAVVAGALGIGAFAAFAGAAPTDLQQTVNELQAKVQALEAQKAPQTAQMNATIASVLADAEQHSQLLANVAGPGAGRDDRGFFVRGADFEIRPSVGLDFRWVLDYRKDAKHFGASDNFEDGFEVNRVRLMLSGYAGSPNLEYFFQWDGGDINGGTGLLDAYLKYRISDTSLAFIAGQMKDPMSQEANVSNFNQLCVDRSLVEQNIGMPDGVGSRVQGLGAAFGGVDDMVHVRALWHDGLGSGNTSFVNGGVNWGAAARVDIKPMGKWADYDDLSARTTSENLLVIGLGGDITQGDNFTAYHFTVDAQYEMPKSLALYGGFLGAYTDNRNAAGNKNTFDWGFVAQAGYAIDQIEPFARFDWTHFQAEQANGTKNLYEITGGVNYYLNSAAKVSVDVTWLPKGSAGAAPYQDILGGSNKTEILVRGQFQLVI